MDQLQSAILQDLLQKFSAELRSGLGPAVDHFLGFFHAINWKEPWLMGLIGSHFLFLLIAITSRKNVNFQMFLFLTALGGVYLAERINGFLGENWKRFAGQNYFDQNGVFLSAVWSGPLLIIAIVILVNTLFSLCLLIVTWKRAELRHRARLSQNKQD